MSSYLFMVQAASTTRLTLGNHRGEPDMTDNTVIHCFY